MSDEKKECEVDIREEEERTAVEMVRTAQQFAVALAHEVVEMGPAISAMKGTPMWDKGIAVADTMASIAFILGCITKLACDECNDEAKGEAAAVLMRWQECVEEIKLAGEFAPPGADVPIQ